MIIDFNEQIKLNKRSNVKINTNNLKPDEIDNIIEQAKNYGNDEIKKLEDAFDDFYKEIKNLAIVEAMEFEEMLKALIINDTVNNLYKPLINAEYVKNLNKDFYNQLRLQIYSSIIKKYNLTEVNKK